MDAKTLLEKIISSSNYDLEEAMFDANELIGVLDPKNKFTLSFKQAIELFAEEHNVCPECGQELHRETYIETSEYLGSPAQEEVENYICTNPECDQFY